MFKTAGHGQYDKLLEKATSNLLLEPDWGSIMQICDLIRQKDCLPKYALQQIKKKINHTNPHVAMFGLQVLESVVKNCGSPIHDEVATKTFMEELRELAKTTQHENVKEKIYELVQTWAHAFRKLTTYRAVQDVLNIMKAEGCKFPPLVETDAMFVADTAPEWADGGCCHRCRVEFGIMNRKHHCRACGQIFCSKCSSKLCTLPKFGIEKEVRVCDSCYDKYAKVPPSITQNPSSKDSMDRILKEVMAASLAEAHSKQQSAPASKSGKTEEELQEEEQLQLALAISQSEAEAKEREAKSRSHGGISSLKSHNHSTFSNDTDKSAEKTSPIKSSGYNTMESEDPELAKYLNRTYWEQRQSVTKEEDSKEETGIKSAPDKVAMSSGAKQTNFLANSNQFSAFMPSAPITENRDRVEPEETDAFVESLRGQIEMFVNRMRSNSSRGRPISYDTSVQSLFMNITTLHSQLLNSIQIQENARAYYEGLQEKLSEVKDARGALDALRQEHTDRLRREAEEAERLRQYQMAQKLQVMRQQKQQYLQCQRQMAMQRMQEQEREMQMRIEQQKIGGAPVPYGAYIPPGMPGYMPGPNVPPGAEMHYMPQMPTGQYMPPPNVGPGGVPQQPVGYPPPTGQQGQFMPQQPIPGQLQGMPPQQPVQQQQPPPTQVHNPQMAGQPGPPPQQQPNSIPPQVQQQQQFYPQSQIIPQQGIPNGMPNNIPAQVVMPPPPPPPPEATVEELISFD